MEKINFINNSLPALSASNLNQIQDNVETEFTSVVGDITSLTTTDKSNVVSAINELDSSKLETSAVKTTETTSATDTYSCTYINGKVEGSTIDYTDYITFASGVTVSSCSGVKYGNVVYIFYDIAKSLSVGNNTIGTVNVALAGPCYGASRTSTSAYVTYPASNVALSNGELRIYCSIASAYSAGTIVLVLA